MSRRKTTPWAAPGLRAGIAITLAAGLLCLGLLCMPSIKAAADRPAAFERVG